jgi:hypothetical protein
MGDGLLTASKHSNYTSIMLYLYHEIDVDYLVTDEGYESLSLAAFASLEVRLLGHDGPILLSIVPQALLL